MTPDAPFEIDQPDVPRQRGPRRKAAHRNPSTWREVIEAVEAKGGRVEITRGTHRVALLPDGGRVTFALTASDHRAIRNVCANLKRAGCDVRRTA